MTDDPTFELHLDEVTADEMALLLGGIGHYMLKAAAHESEGGVVRAGQLLRRVTLEHPEAVRHLLLEAEVGEYMAVSFPPEVLTELDLDRQGGEWVDTRDMEDIDVE